MLVGFTFYAFSALVFYWVLTRSAAHEPEELLDVGIKWQDSIGEHEEWERKAA